MLQIDFQKIVEEYTPSLYRLAYSYCLNRSDAEDVVQEVFLRYLQHKPKCAGPRQLRSWLMTTTANRCKDLLNSRLRQKEIPLEDVHASIDHLDEKIDMELAMAKLSSNLSGVVHLFYYEGMTVNQIADLLHLSRSAVLSRLFKARKQLKKLLGGD